MAAKLKLGHIALRTPLYDESIAFYELFGGKVTHTDSITRDGTTFRLCLMDVGEVRLELIEQTSPPGEPRQTNDLFVHLCFSVQDLDACVADLKAKGITSFRTETVQDRDIFGGIRQINLLGPSGEVLELLEG